MSVVLHPERVKAEIRVRSGTLGHFARENGLSGEQVRDYLRGRSSTAKEAVAKLLGIDPDQLILQRTAVPIRGLRNTATDKQLSRKVNA